jgi:hypothetical protein
MSLSHALLLDPYRFPALANHYAVWLAARTDGAGGVRHTGHPAYDGNFLVVGVPSTTSFEYQVDTVQYPSPPDPAAPGFSPGYYARIWQSDRVVIEDNVIEYGFWTLNPTDLSSRGFGIGFGGGQLSPQFRFPEVALRGNWVRPANNVPDPQKSVAGLTVGSCEQLLLDGNVIEIGSVFSISTNQTGKVWSRDNRTPQGGLLLVNNTAPELDTTLRATLEEAEVLSWLG